MMNKKRTSQVGWGKYLLTLPLFAVLLMVSYACKNKTSTDTNVQNKVVAEAVDTVVTTDTVAVPPPPPLKSTIKFTAPAHAKKAKAVDVKTLKFTAPIIFTMNGNDTIFNYGNDYMQMAQYLGGNEELSKFIRENLKYPASAAESGIEDKVFIQFIIYKTGKIGEIKVVRGSNKACKDEAVRVIKAMPHWKPAILDDGEAVNTYYTLPIIFKLQK